ncbi:hypothetical protein [Peptostreptococcus sp.]
MRDYQRRKNNKYYLPKSVYHRTLWVIRDYERMKEEAESLVEISGVNTDGMPRGNEASDQVSRMVIKRCDLLKDVKVIDMALELIPEEYRAGVWNNIQYNKSYPTYAGARTFARYKAIFIHSVAKGLNYI